MAGHDKSVMREGEMKNFSVDPDSTVREGEIANRMTPEEEIILDSLIKSGITDVKSSLFKKSAILAFNSSYVDNAI